MIVVAVEYRIVDQFHFLPLLSPAFRDLLLRWLALPQGRGVGSVDLIHEVSHEFLAEAVEGGAGEGRIRVLLVLGGLVGLEGVADGFVDGMG
jgi:hypothetical protein